MRYIRCRQHPDLVFGFFDSELQNAINAENEEWEPLFCV